VALSPGNFFAGGKRRVRKGKVKDSASTKSLVFFVWLEEQKGKTSQSGEGASTGRFLGGEISTTDVKNSGVSEKGGKLGLVGGGGSPLAMKSPKVFRRGA